MPTWIKIPRSTRGFTLIELLVVIGILSLISSAIIFSTNNAREKGKDAHRKGDLKAIASALTLYYADNKTYPVNVSGDLSYASDGSQPWIPNLATYMQKPDIPKDPLQAKVETFFAKAQNKLGGIRAFFNKSKNTNIATAGRVSGVSNGTLGNNHIGPSTDSAQTGYLTGSKFTMGPNTGTVTNISVYVGTPIDPVNNQYVLAIYTDVSGKPGTKIVSAQGTLSTPDFKYNQSVSATLNANTSYWLLYGTNTPASNKNGAKYDPGSNGAFFSATFGTFPSGASASPQNTNYSIYVDYTYNSSSGNTTINLVDGTYDEKRATNECLINSQVDAFGKPFPSGFRDSAMKYTNVNIPYKAHINSASLTFKARDANSDTTTNVKISAQKGSTNPSLPNCPPTGGPWAGQRTLYHPWNPQQAWAANGTYNSADDGGDFADVLNDLISDSTSWPTDGTTPGKIVLIIEDDPSTPQNSGRVPYSADPYTCGANGCGGDGVGPILNVSWTIDPITCASASGLTLSGASVSTQITISGGNNVPSGYTYSSDGGGTLSPSGGSAFPIVTYTTSGIKHVTVGDNSGTATCIINVTSSGTPQDIPGSSGLDVACGKITPAYFYCYRVSQDKKHFTLWARLENTNDPEIKGGPSAVCNEDRPNAGDFLNYCITSPK